MGALGALIHPLNFVLQEANLSIAFYLYSSVYFAFKGFQAPYLNCLMLWRNYAATAFLFGRASFFMHPLLILLPS